MSSKKKDVKYGGEPRVQLLPPSIAEREKLRQARSLAGLTIVLALIVSGAGIGGAYVISSAAETALTDAHDDTVTITAQQAQYAPGALAAAEVAAGTEAISVVGATDVDWKTVFAEVRRALPEGTLISTLGVTARAPWENQQISSSALRGVRESTVMMTLASAKPLDWAKFTRMLEAHVDAYADSFVFQNRYIPSREVYETEVELTLDASILTQRYAVDQVEELLADDRVTAAVNAANSLDAQREAIKNPAPAAADDDDADDTEEGDQQ